MGANRIPANEIITCKSYFPICDYIYEPELPALPTGIVHCDISLIPEFFSKIQHNKNKYVVVSSYSDFGLCYQSEYPVWNDLKKAMALFANPQIGYRDFTMPARCNKAKCKETDKFSIKCYSFTEATFDEIPSNVLHWFLVNNGVTNNPRLTTIPFGIAEGCAERITQYTPKTDSRKNSLYVNFQFYTPERADLFQFYAPMPHATVNRELPFEVFLEDLASHQAVLCPVGNGWDCYRTLEALYMECFPIVEDVAANKFLQNRVPAVFMNSLYNIPEELLVYLDQCREKVNWDLDFIKLSFWRDKIKETAKTLL